MEVRLAIDDNDLLEAARVLIQLRPGYTANTLVRQVKRQVAEGYQLACAELDGRVVAVAGFVVSQKLAWGKHIYVDDLVVDETLRRTGAGTALVNWLKAYGRDNGCEQLHLDSGVQRFDAHRFYLKNGFDISSHHFSTDGLDTQS